MKCSKKRALILLSGVGASLYPILSCALGLGDLQVDSRLNQPLRAHIEITDVGEEEWRQIHARLVPQSDGALLRTVLDTIVFRTTEDASHRHFVEVSSNDPITEPLFDLSVAVAGQTVQVIRNYSVFLDPPGRDELGSRGVMVAGATQAVESPVVATAASARGAGGAASGASASGSRAAASAADRVAAGAGGSRANARRAARSAAVRSMAGGVAAGTAGVGANQHVELQAGAVYTVVQSDTLERIVRRLGARTAAAKNQQMQWVFEQNPRAFYGSMDRLRAGAQLMLPGQGAAAAATADGANRVSATGARATLPEQGGAATAATARGTAPVAAVSGSTAPAGSGTNTVGAANVSNMPAAAKAPEAQPTPVAKAEQKVAADDRVLQAQLEGQVGTLQQALAKMQETIAAQDAEIADLNRKIAARAEQEKAERATSALAARIAPEVASASDAGAQETGARPSTSEAVDATQAGGAEESGSGSGRVRTIAAASAGDDTTVARRPPRWWAKRATYYWGGALAVAILAAVIATVIRRRREAEVQYAPRYPLVEESPFRYRATLEPQPPAKPAAPQPEPQVRKSTSSVHVEEESGESGLESWSTQTALLSELPEPDDTQPFMMAPHDDVETEFENKRKSYAPGTQDPTAKLQAMETQTMDLQTTGELMTPEELAEAELLGMEAPGGPEYDRQDRSRWSPGGSGRGGQEERQRTSGGQGQFQPGERLAQGEGRQAANEPGPFARGESEPGRFGRGEVHAGSGSSGSSHGAPANSGANRTAAPTPGTDADNARTLEIGSAELLAAEALTAPTNPEATRTVEMDLTQLRAAQLSTAEINAAELRRDRTAVNKEVAEILEASLSYEPDRVDIKLKLLEIYHHEALGNRNNFRSLLSKLAKDSRLSPDQRQHLETLQRTLNEGKQDADSSFVAEVAI
jgi:Tfp pilus assembly protein FimV